MKKWMKWLALVLGLPIGCDSKEPDPPSNWRGIDSGYEGQQSLRPSFNPPSVAEGGEHPCDI